MRISKPEANRPTTIGRRQTAAKLLMGLTLYKLRSIIGTSLKALSPLSGTSYSLKINNLAIEAENFSILKLNQLIYSLNSCIHIAHSEIFITKSDETSVKKLLKGALVATLLRQF